MKGRGRLSAVCAAAVFLAGGRCAWASGVELPPPLQIGGWNLSHDTVIMSGVVALLIYVLCWLGRRTLSKDNPGRAQVVLELIVSSFDGLIRQAIGPNRGRKYLPYIGTLFLFVWTSNMIGLLPLPHWQLGGEAFHDYNHNGRFDPGEFDPALDENGNGKHDPGFLVPAFEEPTKNINVPLGLAILFVILIGHGSEIYYHGLMGYLKGYFSPGGIIGVFMFPLNVVSKGAELVSISFRLFGNIFGGVVIIVVVSGLLHYMILPLGLYFFFGIFVGTVQAFVFTMLAMTYIATGCAEE